MNNDIMQNNGVNFVHVFKFCNGFSIFLSISCIYPIKKQGDLFTLNIFFISHLCCLMLIHSVFVITGLSSININLFFCLPIPNMFVLYFVIFDWNKILCHKKYIVECKIVLEGIEKNQK